MSKTTIVILADPESGEEALGRAFNGLATAYDIKESGGDVSILLQGTGTRWIGYFTQKEHPLNGLYNLVKDKIEGVSSGCADFFGGGEEATTNGYNLITENLIPGTSGLPSIAKRVSADATILTF